MKAVVYNQQGEKTGETVLPKEIFGIDMNFDLVHQVVTSQMANRRRVIAKTKDRAEVRGGGKKPWKQKGTGRARHGSIRSPLWKGGGVTFGPLKERVFSKNIPKKMKRKALFMVLSAKAKDNSLVILDELNIVQPKTKLIKDVLAKFPFEGKSCLLALATIDKNVILAARNIPAVKTMQVKDLNCLDLLNHKHLIILKEGLKTVKDVFLK